MLLLENLKDIGFRSSLFKQLITGSKAVLNLAMRVKEPQQFKKFQHIAANLADQMYEKEIQRIVNISGAVSTLQGEQLKINRKTMNRFTYFRIYFAGK